MYCNKCECENPQNAEFCRQCGSELKISPNRRWIGFMLVLVVIVVIGCIVSAKKIQFTNSNSSYETHTETEKVISETEKQIIYDWGGVIKAESCVGNTAGGTGICYVLEFVLNKVDDKNYIGRLNMEGYQLAEYANITAYASGKRLKIYFKSNTGDGMFGLRYSEGDALVELKYNNDKTLSADWFLPLQDFVNEDTTISKAE